MRIRAILLSPLWLLGAATGSRRPVADGRVRPPLAAAAAPGVIAGRVVVAGTQSRLSYSVVTIESLNRESFTDDSGRFMLRDVPAGRVILRAKHIGYVPVDLPVAVPEGDTVRVTIEMTKVAVQLPAVKSVGACTKPGAPRREVDPALAVLFDQLRQNAERSRLLIRSYPFQYTVLQVKTVRSSRDPAPPPDTVLLDTFTVAAARDWRYKPGNIIRGVPDSVGYHQVLMLPELGDFADDAFIANHCFAYGGVERAGGAPDIRIDFAPADKIKQPDIAGSVDLDSATFQIRSAQIVLTKLSPSLRRAMSDVTVESRYSELAPGIPMMSAYSSTTTFSDSLRALGVAATLTTQRILDVQWLKGKP